MKVVYIDDANSINEMYDTFKQVGKVTGKEKEADKLVSKVKKEIEDVVKDVPKDQQGKKYLWKFLLNLTFTLQDQIRFMMIC